MNFINERLRNIFSNGCELNLFYLFKVFFVFVSFEQVLLYYTCRDIKNSLTWMLNFGRFFFFFGGLGLPKLPLKRFVNSFFMIEMYLRGFYNFSSFRKGKIGYFGSNCDHGFSLLRSCLDVWLYGVLVSPFLGFILTLWIRLICMFRGTDSTQIEFPQSYFQFNTNVGTLFVLY